MLVVLVFCCNTMSKIQGTAGEQNKIEACLLMLKAKMYKIYD